MDRAIRIMMALEAKREEGSQKISRRILGQILFLVFYYLFSIIGSCRHGEVKETGESRVSRICVL